MIRRVRFPKSRKQVIRPGGRNETVPAVARGVIPITSGSGRLPVQLLARLVATTGLPAGSRGREASVLPSKGVRKLMALQDVDDVPASCPAARAGYGSARHARKTSSDVVTSNRDAITNKEASCNRASRLATASLRTTG